MEDRTYMQRYAMLFGTYLGGLWILTSIFFPLGVTMPFLFIIFMVLTLSSPFIAYHYTKKYRDVACGGYISFSHAWVFTVMLHIFAALLAAVAHYVYFRFIDGGFIVNAYEQMTDNFFYQYGSQDMDMYKEQIENAIDTLRQMTSIEMTVQLMSSNILWGTLLSIPIAIFAMKKDKRNKLA